MVTLSAVRWILGLCVVALACGDDDGTINPDAAVVCTEDSQCSDGLFCNGLETCDPTNASANALGCVLAAPSCLDGQICEESESRCVTRCDGVTDADADGSDAVECGGDDCDDSNPNRYPGNTEVCDDMDLDEDCDPSTYGRRDLDRDGFDSAACCNGDNCGTDCDDTRRASHPLSVEQCDGLDNDCDADVDEDVSLAGFEDLDGDGWGNAERTMMACAGSARFSTQAGDCDDTEPQRHPAQIEVTDTIDNDCDDATDESTIGVRWFPDVDMDGYGDPNGVTVFSDTRPPGDWSLIGTDCNDADALIQPAADEVCNGIDDDCNGLLDAVVGINDWEDDDGDGVADAACGGVDCDDADRDSLPGASELCDGRDNDCDGTVDEDVVDLELYVDLDGDGYGSGLPTMQCAPTGTFATQGGDCDDTNALIHPGAVEICDGVSQSCGATVDDGARCALPGAIATCAAGACTVASCLGGALDCNGDPSDGCEVDSSSSTAHCGRCNNPCATCTAGVCMGDVLQTWFSFSVNGFWLDSAAGIPAAEVSVDLPSSPVATGVGDFYTIQGFGPPPSTAVLLFSGVDASPTLVPYDSSAGFDLPYFMTNAERTALEGMTGELMEGRGIVVLESPHNERDCPGSDITDYASMVFPDDEDIVEESMANGDSDTELHYYVNVPPGPVTIATSSEVFLAAPVPPVRPGHVSVAKVLMSGSTCP